MSMEQFNTVDTDHKTMQYVETPAMMVIDGDGNLIFSGFAHDNLMRRSPLVKMEAKTVQYVTSEPEPKSVGRFVEFRRNCVRLRCYATERYTSNWTSTRRVGCSAVRCVTQTQTYRHRQTATHIWDTYTHTHTHTHTH